MISFVEQPNGRPQDYFEGIGKEQILTVLDVAIGSMP